MDMFSEFVMLNSANKYRWLAAMLVVLCLGHGQMVVADTLDIVGDEWCPYNCSPGDLEPGFMIEIAESALSQFGHKVVYKTVPWSRALEDARAGTYAGVVGAYKEDAPGFIFPETVIAESGNYFFVLPDNTWKFEGIASLAKISLGAIQSYAYGPELDAYIKENQRNPAKVQLVAGDTALAKNISKLKAGRIQVLVEDRAVVKWYLTHSAPGLVLKEVGVYHPGAVYVAFSPANPKSKEYAKQLDEGIDVIKKSGKFAEILNRYSITQ